MNPRILFLTALLWAFAASTFGYEYILCGDEPCTWSSYPVHYLINEKGTPDRSDEDEIVEKSFSRWAQGHQTFCELEFKYDGTTQIDESAYDEKNVVYWVEKNWEYSKQVLALTQCWFNNQTNRFLDCDIAVNGQDYSWDDLGQESGNVDLRSTLTHEIGHLWGLDHSDVPAATMYAYYDPRSNAADLDYDDINGAYRAFCEGLLPKDDEYEQNDSSVQAVDFGEETFTLYDLRLYDQDWFKIVIPKGYRAKVIFRDDDLLRSKNIYLIDYKGEILDVAPCDGDCAVALGDAEDDPQVGNILVDGEFDDYTISEERYDLKVEMVLPGEEGDLYDDDDSTGGSDEGCGCNMTGDFNSKATNARLAWFLLLGLIVFSLAVFCRR